MLRAELAARSPDPSLMSLIVAAFTALGYALSARALLLLALIGAFVLAMTCRTQLDLVLLFVYAAFTVVPVTVLEIRKR